MMEYPKWRWLRSKSLVSHWFLRVTGIKAALDREWEAGRRMGYREGFDHGYHGGGIDQAEANDTTTEMLREIAGRGR